MKRLVLKRSVGEGIQIGAARLIIDRAHGGKFQLAVSAPEDVQILNDVLDEGEIQIGATHLFILEADNGKVRLVVIAPEDVVISDSS